jgi:electron transport complex protein RnfA
MADINYMAIIIGAIFINNFVLVKFLGLCPFFGVSKKTSSALGMGLAVIFVMAIASAVTSVIYVYLLVPGSLEFMRIVVFILVIAGLVQLIEMVIRKYSPDLYKSLGIYLPLITTNCAVLGVALLNVGEDYGVLPSVVNGLASGAGFTLALLIMSGVRERLELADVPESFRDAPVAFISAVLMGMGFAGFGGVV